MSSTYPRRPSTFLQRYLNYSSSYGSEQTMDNSHGMGTMGDDNHGQGSMLNNRSMSHTLLSQFAQSTSGFRSPSPSTGFYRSHGLSRTPSLQRGAGNMTGYHRGPSLQSLVKSFINRVSRGTQTDSNDDFDNVSIASMQTGFSEYANDLTKSRLKLFLNDQMQFNSGLNSYANSNVDEQEFVDELKKLRDDINGHLNTDGLPISSGIRGSQESFVFDDDLDQNVSIRLLPKSQRASRFPSPEREYQSKKQPKETVSVSTQYEIELCHRSTETEKQKTFENCSQTTLPKLTNIASQTDPIKKEEPEIKIIEKIVPETKIETRVEIREVFVEKPKPKMISIETQTDVPEVVHSPPTQECLRCLERDAEMDSLIQANKNARLTSSQYNHVVHHEIPITKCEFVISHADIVCNGNSIPNGTKVSSINKSDVGVGTQVTQDINENIEQLENYIKKDHPEMAAKATAEEPSIRPQNHIESQASSPEKKLTESGKELPETKTMKKKRKKKVFQRILSGEKTKPRVIVVNESDIRADDGSMDDKVRPQCCTIS